MSYSLDVGWILLDAEMMRFRRFGPLSVSRLTKACTSYVGKMAQLYELADRFSDNNIMVIDYDGLVFDKGENPIVHRIGL